jgi:hypothetical protein
MITLKLFCSRCGIRTEHRLTPKGTAVCFNGKCFHRREPKIEAQEAVDVYRRNEATHEKTY